MIEKGGKEILINKQSKLCRKAFCESLLVIPRTLAENSGLEKYVTLLELVKLLHQDDVNFCWHAINLENGEIESRCSRYLVLRCRCCRCRYRLWYL